MSLGNTTRKPQARSSPVTNNIPSSPAAAKPTTVTLTLQDEGVVVDLDGDVIELAHVRAMLESALVYVSILEVRDPSISGH